MALASTYPTTATARDRFVLSRRGGRAAHDPWQHQGVSCEDERGVDGRPWRSATVFLTGRECPWRCVMCDLWSYTTPTDTPRGALVQQVSRALDDLRTAGEMPAIVKFYNAGSFFDPRAVPEADYEALATLAQPFRRVVVESHPSLIGPRLQRFQDALQRATRGEAPVLEVAMGLETAHPLALEALHKRVTLGQFMSAASAVQCVGGVLRAFVLVGVPFIARGEQAEWVRRSVETAFEAGATAVSLIPTRTGNGALDDLADTGDFEPPTLADLEAALDATIPLGRERTRAGTADVRVFADVWDLERLMTCAACAGARRTRMVAMNLEQRVLPRVQCRACHGGGVAT